MYNYNTFHRKNVNTQFKVIDSRNYTYQTIIRLIDSLGTAELINKSVLDVGCGVGTIDFYMASKRALVSGIDISSRAVSLANRSKKGMKMSNVNFQSGDIDSISINGKYDLIVISEVIEHVKNPELLMGKLNKSLNKKGRMIISTPLSTAPLFRWGLLNQFENDVGHLRRYSANELEILVKKYNFEIEKTLVVEGLLRNLLFTSKYFGFLLKFVKWPVSILVNQLDSVLISIFGASNIYLVCRKV